ncbi:MAG: hypothetical protein HC838_08545 [Spirulinaceae cyanobacterium RM2_2_10]|nr:hypothetical protein [Spirulinaceae cyanobacterium SM2_1_0]NJO20082.1 hypothetical protein [Spirulinaceae cyanobacterium RM2_2_10]
MTDSGQTATELSIPTWTEQIMVAGEISSQEHFQLVSLFLSELATSETDRQAINRVLDEIQSGRLYFRD